MEKCIKCGKMLEGVTVSGPRVSENTKCVLETVASGVASVGKQMGYLPAGKIVGSLIGILAGGATGLFCDAISGKWYTKYTCSCGYTWCKFIQENENNGNERDPKEDRIFNTYILRKCKIQKAWDDIIRYAAKDYEKDPYKLYALYMAYAYYKKDIVNTMTNKVLPISKEEIILFSDDERSMMDELFVEIQRI